MPEAAAGIAVVVVVVAQVFHFVSMVDVFEA